MRFSILSHLAYKGRKKLFIEANPKKPAFYKLLAKGLIKRIDYKATPFLVVGLWAYSTLSVGSHTKMSKY